MPNIEFVSISLDRDKKEWLDKLEKDKPSWQQYIIPDNFESEFAKEYNITFIPRFMLFDKEGKIISIDAPRPSDDEALLFFSLSKKRMCGINLPLCAFLFLLRFFNPFVKYDIKLGWGIVFSRQSCDFSLLFL